MTISPREARKAEWLARELSTQSRRLSKLETKSDLGYSSIDDGVIQEKDAAGNLVGAYGKQFDGTHTAVSMSGPTPPTPWFPTASAVPGVVEVRWNGKFAGGAVSPLDLKHVAAYVVPTGGVLDLTAQAGVMTGELGDTVQVQKDPGVYDVYLVAWTLSGKYSDAAGPVSVVVPSLVDAEAMTQRLDAADEAIQDTQDALDATTLLLDTRLDTAEAGLSASNARLDVAEGQLTDAFGQIAEVQTAAGKAVTHGSAPPSGAAVGKSLWVTPSGHTYISQECTV